MSEWQPIETAPKDSTKVDLWVIDPRGDGVRVTGCWWGPWFHKELAKREDAGWHRPSMIESGVSGVPTHWMPLPEPPVYLKEGEQ